MGFLVFKSISSSISSTSKLFQTRALTTNFAKFTNQVHPRSPFAYVNHIDHLKQNFRSLNLAYSHLRILGSQSHIDTKCYRTNSTSSFSHPMISNTNFQNKSIVTLINPISSFRSYSSNGDNSSEWLDKAKDAWNSVTDTAAYTGEKAKEASNEITPYVQHVLDSHPYLENVIIPIGCTLTATILAWVVMPSILRRFHKYSMRGAVALLHGTLTEDQVPYEKSVWSALEDPVRYLITFMSFSQIAMMVAPTTIASQYIQPAWRGAVILSFVWFLNRWKTNVFARALAGHSIGAPDRERLMTLDKLSSVGLFVLGLMALAEACGVAVQSILTVGGIGGVATAFAAKDILGNVLSGLSMQFSRPFSLGDTIKAGSIEGQVVEMGLTTTSLLNAEKFPVIVPNSLFSSQVIVNKSRAQWRAVVKKIPLGIHNLDSIPQICDDIRDLLRSNSKVFLDKEAPYCFLSRVESSFAELTLGCNLRHMSKSELYTTEQDILLQSVQIIIKHGAKLGSAREDITSQ